MTTQSDAWPPLPVAEWADTYATLHMWTQVVGKVRLALTPLTNHWWNVTLYLTARGLTTSPMPYRDRTVEIQFDFIDHTLAIEMSDGRRETIALQPQSVASFYKKMLTTLARLGVDVRIWPMPVEVPSPVRFDRDEQHASYDREYANRWWRVAASTATVMNEFRSRFLGKSSPVHFFWGSFDLAVTRFSGRRAPAREGADAMTREAYSHEVSSAGFWPGIPGKMDAAFYAYAAPEPAGFKTARVAPSAAFYGAEFGEFFLKYDDVRTSSSPGDTLREFLQTTYEAAATLGEWNRAELERAVGV
jgi:Family of unknown function (DUF5996)